MCSALSPLRLSWVRREVLPSMAMSSCRPGHSAAIQSSKQRPNSTGSIAVDQCAQPALAGNAMVERREFSQKVEMVLAPGDDIVEIVARRRWWRRSATTGPRQRVQRPARARGRPRASKNASTVAPTRPWAHPRRRKNRSYRSSGAPCESERPRNHISHVNAKIAR